MSEAQKITPVGVSHEPRIDAALVARLATSAEDSLNQLWEMANGNEDAHRLLKGLWTDMGNMRKLLMTADAVVGMAVTGINEMTHQRDMIAEELAIVVRALDTHDQNSQHEIVSRFISETYDTVMENHNAAFWESLPYDMAATLGGDWNFMDADKLYTLITLDMNDDMPEDHGWTASQVNTFRERLRRLLAEVADDGDE